MGSCSPTVGTTGVLVRGPVKILGVQLGLLVIVLWDCWRSCPVRAVWCLYSRYNAEAVGVLVLLELFGCLYSRYNAEAVGVLVLLGLFGCLYSRTMLRLLVFLSC